MLRGVGINAFFGESGMMEAYTKFLLPCRNARSSLYYPNLLSGHLFVVIQTNFLWVICCTLSWMLAHYLHWWNGKGEFPLYISGVKTSKTATKDSLGQLIVVGSGFLPLQPSTMPQIRLFVNQKVEFRHNLLQRIYSLLILISACDNCSCLLEVSVLSICLSQLSYKRLLRMVLDEEIVTSSFIISKSWALLPPPDLSIRNLE